MGSQIIADLGFGRRAVSRETRRNVSLEQFFLGGCAGSLRVVRPVPGNWLMVWGYAPCFQPMISVLGLWYHFLDGVWSGFPFRGVEASSSNCCSVMESIISLAAPCNLDFGVWPRLAESAAPAACCWALDFAGTGYTFLRIGAENIPPKPVQSLS